MKASQKFYPLQKILQKKLTPAGPMYLVKWKNYSKSQSTWEPQGNLSEAMGMVEQYEKVCNSGLGKKHKKIRKKSKEMGKEGKEKQLSITMFMKKKSITFDSQNTSKEINVEEEQEVNEIEKIGLSTEKKDIPVQSNFQEIENQQKIVDNDEYEKPEPLKQEFSQICQEDGKDLNNERVLLIKSIQEKRRVYDFEGCTLAFNGNDFHIDKIEKQKEYRISTKDMRNLNPNWLKNFYQSFL